MKIKKEAGAGLTLIELLVIISIILTIIGILSIVLAGYGISVKHILQHMLS